MLVSTLWGNRVVLSSKKKFRLLGGRLKTRTAKVGSSEVLPVPCAGQSKRAQIRSLIPWMRQWYKEEEFKLVRQWDAL